MSSVLGATFLGPCGWEFEGQDGSFSIDTGETLGGSVLIVNAKFSSALYGGAFPSGWPNSIAGCRWEFMNDNGDPLFSWFISGVEFVSGNASQFSFSSPKGGTITVNVGKDQITAILDQVTASYAPGVLPSINPFLSYGMRFSFSTADGEIYPLQFSAAPTKLSLTYATYPASGGRGYAGSTNTYNYGYFDFRQNRFYVNVALPHVHSISAATIAFIEPLASPVTLWAFSTPSLVTGAYSGLIQSVTFPTTVSVIPPSGVTAISCEGTLDSSSLLRLPFTPAQGNIYWS